MVYRMAILLLIALLSCHLDVVWSQTVIRVSKNGTDDLQCLSNNSGNWTTPEAMACASLNYAFSHAKNNTHYFIDCGAYPLYPFQGITPFWHLEDIQIHSICPEMFQVNVTCTAKSNLLFHQTTAITIVGLQFKHCGPGELVQGIPERPSSLYFHACRDVTMLDVYVEQSSGRGITFYNTMGNNSLSFMVGLCNGTGVYFEFTGCPEEDPTPDSTCEGAQYFIYSISNWNNYTDVGSGVDICNADSLPTPSNPFEGFGGGLSIIFRENARGNSISFESIFGAVDNRAAISGGGMFIGHFDNSSENVVLFEPRNLGNRTYSFVINGVTGVNMSSAERIIGSCLYACNGAGGGVSVLFCGVSNSNKVTFLTTFKIEANLAPFGGGGMFIGHFDNSFNNTVTLGDTSASYSHTVNVILNNLVYGDMLYELDGHGADYYVKNSYRYNFCGGGLLVFYCNQSHSSGMNMTSVAFFNNTAEAGGGVCAIYKDSSNRHQVSQFYVYIGNSVLHESKKPDKSQRKFQGRGGGMLTVFQSSAAMNNITSYSSLLINNTAFTSGGGLFAGFYDKASNNTISMKNLSSESNTAKQVHTVNVTPGMADGRGGGVSIVFSDEASHNMLSGHSWVFGCNSAAHGGGVHIRFANWAIRNRVYINGSVIFGHLLLHQKAFSTASNQQSGGGGICIEFFTNWQHRQTASSNIVNLTNSILYNNTAADLVGGGISVVDWGYGADYLEVSFCSFLGNVATYGAAISMETFPSFQVGISTTYGVLLGPNNSFFANVSTADPGGLPWFQQSGLGSNWTSLFDASTIQHNTAAISPLNYLLSNIKSFHGKIINYLLSNIKSFHVKLIKNFLEEMKERVEHMSARLDAQLSEIKWVNFNVQYRIDLESTGKGLVYLQSTRVAVKGEQVFMCMGQAQGVFAADSVLHLDSSANIKFYSCVATHGGAMALYSDSTMVVTDGVKLSYIQNYALQHGGAIYVDASHGPHTSVQDCFLQYHSKENPTFSPHLWEHVDVLFANNSAGQEGNSVYISDALTCMPSLTDHDAVGGDSSVNSSEVLKWSNVFQYIPQGCSDKDTSCNLSGQVASGPSTIQCRAENSSVNCSTTFTVIPGKETQLPIDGVLDDYGNKVQSVFSVQLLNPHGALNLSVDPFSRYTSDFKVILRGVPNTYMLKMGDQLHTSTNNTTTVYTPQLFLQSVENEKLVLAGNVVLQCCPAGYSLDLKQLKCSCLDKKIPAITNCNSTSYQANLASNYWIGYLPSEDVGSCDGQRLYYSPCPPGFCRPDSKQLPPNNSAEELNKVVCKAGRRTGVLCGDCAAGHSATVNFGALSPNCVDCSETLSVVGLIIWIISEWVPLTIMLVIVLLFNVDLLSGHMNSFLLFAQILSLSFMRANTASSSVYLNMAKIPKFLYGFWNLNYFGVFLPPYCLTPTAHLTTMQVLLLQCTIGLVPLLIVFTLVALEKCSDKYWRCLVCRPIRKGLARLRDLKAKVSGNPSYDRALSTFFVLGYTRFLVVSAYILVKASITSTTGDVKDVVWWQGTIEYASVNHIAFMIPSLVILLFLVIVPTLVLLAVPVLPQVYGRMRYSRNRHIHCLGKWKVFDYLCLGIFTGRWIWHFINVFQGCFKDRFRFFAGFFLLYRIAQLMATLLPTRVEDSFIIQIALCLGYMLLLTACQPYHRKLFNIVDVLILGDLALILLLDLKLVYATPGDGLVAVIVIQQALMYLPLMYLFGLLGTMAYQKCKRMRAAARERAEMERPSLENVEEDGPDRLRLIEHYRSITHLRPPRKEEEYDSEEEEEYSSEESDIEMYNLAK